MLYWTTSGRVREPDDADDLTACFGKLISMCLSQRLLLCINGVVEFVYDVSTSGFRLLRCGSKVDISRGSQAHWIVPMYRLMCWVNVKALCPVVLPVSLPIFYTYTPVRGGRYRFSSDLDKTSDEALITLIPCTSLRSLFCVVGSWESFCADLSDGGECLECLESMTGCSTAGIPQLSRPR